MYRMLRVPFYVLVSYNKLKSGKFEMLIKRKDLLNF